MTVLLALCSALAYGLADFVGGVGSRRASPWAMAFTAGVAGALLGFLATPLVGGSPTTADLLWGTAAGVGAGVGTGFLYRGLSAGRMGVVAPVSGVGAALVPVVVALLTGERPELLVWLGVGAALPGIWLVSRTPSGSDTGSTGLLDGILAGLGFGAQFAGLAQVGEGSGVLPLALNQASAALVVVLLAVALRSDWVPRDQASWVGAVCGALGLAATGAFLVAAQIGPLTVAAILSSLYPAVTVVLAIIVLRERILAAQAAGLVLCILAVGLVAAG